MNDYECLYNHCVFNDEAPIIHCDTIYKYFAIFEYSYIHCGDLCNNDNECSSERCTKGSYSSYVVNH